MSRWTFAILGLWALLFGWSIAEDRVPVSHWFQPEQLMLIADAPQGICNRFDWARTIKRPFFGRWTAVLQRQADNGQWRYYRSFSGQSDYRPDAVLPEAPRRTLAWWFEVDPAACAWPPGTYRVVTVWAIFPNTGDPRRTRITSQPFQILPPRS